MSIKWLLVTLLILPALALAANIVTRVLDGQAYPLFFSYNPQWSVIPMFIMAFIFNGVFEEFGWRGYVLPRFQARWNALTSSPHSRCHMGCMACRPVVCSWDPIFTSATSGCGVSEQYYFRY